MNNDLISRSELKKAIDTYDKFACLPTNHLVPVRHLLCPETYEKYVHFRDVIKCIDNAPPVEARPTGEWITTNRAEEYYDEVFKCSVCGVIDFLSNFCPNCGARMVEGGEEE